MKKEWVKLLQSNDFRDREELAELLGKKRTQSAYDLLIKLLHDKQSLVRSSALEALIELGRREGFNEALPLLKDKNEIVRVDAIECVAILGERGAVKYFVGMLDDRSPLVKSYAALYVGDYGDSSNIKILEDKLTTERSTYVRMGLFFGLYLLGRDEKLVDIIKLLKSRQYRVRCSVANNLVGLVDENNKKTIVEALTQALSAEETVAARSSIESALNEIT